MESSFATFDVSDKVISDNKTIFANTVTLWMSCMAALLNPSELLGLGQKIRIRAPGLLESDEDKARKGPPAASVIQESCDWGNREYEIKLRASNI